MSNLSKKKSMTIRIERGQGSAQRSLEARDQFGPPLTQMGSSRRHGHDRQLVLHQRRTPEHRKSRSERCGAEAEQPSDLGGGQIRAR